MNTPFTIVAAFGLLVVGCATLDHKSARSPANPQTTEERVTYRQLIVPPTELAPDHAIAPSGVWIRGSFSRSELMALLQLVQSQRDWVGPQGGVAIDGTRPVFSIQRWSDSDDFERRAVSKFAQEHGHVGLRADDVVVVMLLSDQQSGQTILLRQVGAKWSVIDVGGWVA